MAHLLVVLPCEEAEDGGGEGSIEEEGGGDHGGGGDEADEVEFVAILDEGAGDLSAIERHDGEEVDEGPPEVDPEERAGDFEPVLLFADEGEEVVGFREGAGVEEGDLGHGFGVLGAEDEDEGEVGGDEEEESGTGSPGDAGEVAVAGEAAAVVGGEAAEGVEFDGGMAAAGAASGDGVAEFVDEDGDEGDGDEEDEADEAVAAVGVVCAAEHGGDEPEEGLDDYWDAEEGEAEHGERVGWFWKDRKKREWESVGG